MSAKSRFHGTTSLKGKLTISGNVIGMKRVHAWKGNKREIGLAVMIMMIVQIQTTTTKMMMTLDEESDHDMKCFKIRRSHDVNRVSIERATSRKSDITKERQNSTERHNERATC